MGASTVSRETAIGAGATALAVAAMAVDHLLGDDPGLEDPPGFVLTAGLSVAAAAVVFGVVVPRSEGDRAAVRAIVSSALALLALPLTLWLGLPFVLGGGGVALGLLGREGERRRLATAALVIGAIAVLLGTAAYAVQAVQKLS